MTPKEIAIFYEKRALGSFSTKLMDLIGNADTLNKARIGIAFPEYVEAHNIWFYKPEGWDKFEEEKK